MKKCLSTLYYADGGISFLNLGFENDVNMYGTQANRKRHTDFSVFENDVNMYGTQALTDSNPATIRFENDVNMYGTQANIRRLIFNI